MQKCKVCGGTDFLKEAGFFFCQTCQTQDEDIREEILELHTDLTTRLRRKRIRPLRLEGSGEEVGWTSWELYNFVLIGLTNELIKLGVTTDIKLTILQLWATYLSKIEVAFISTKQKCVPKLARRYYKRDAAIIYGKVQSQKRVRKRKRTGSSTTASLASGFQSEGSSLRDLSKNKKLLATAEYDRFMQSQESSEGDALSTLSQSFCSGQSSSGRSSTDRKIRFSSHAREEANKIKRLSKNVSRKKRVKYRQNHISTQYKTSPYIVTPMKLWAIIYLALRIHNEPIHLGDMLRYGREGHLSYYKLDHLLPSEISLTKTEVNLLSQKVEITHKGMRRIVASMAKLIGVWDIICPDFSPLVRRYCQELGLPRGVQLYTERLITLSPPRMSFDSKSPCIPNYEGRAMAYIIVVLKTLFALDGITEYEISRVAENLNSIAAERRLVDFKLFSFREWQSFIECRKAVLIHSHFPTKLKYYPKTHGIDGLYVKFLEFINSKSDREEPEITNRKFYLPEELIAALKKHLCSYNDTTESSKEIDFFPPSLTPLHSYIQQLLNHPLYELPSIVHNDFFLTKVGYLTKPQVLMESAVLCNTDLEIVDSNLHFVEKIVFPFEQHRMPSVEELQEPVEVESNVDDDNVNRIETLCDYMHRKLPCSIQLNSRKRELYDRINNSSKISNDSKPQYGFSFNDVLPNGRLAIPTDNNSVPEEDTVNCENINRNDALLQATFCDKYNLSLSCTEKEAIRRPGLMKSLYFKKNARVQVTRNSKGQFVKGTNAPIQVEESFTEDNSFVEINEPFIGNSTKLDVEEEENKDLNEILAEEILPQEFVDVNALDIGDLDEDMSFMHLDLDSINLTNFSLYENNEETIPMKTEEDMSNVKMKFFRPFNNYWMYHCIFSRVKPKNFEIFEKSLPRSFRWLLNECAHIVEMTTADLYEEVCLIENYHSHIFKSSDTANAPPQTPSTKTKQLSNIILRKW